MIKTETNWELRKQIEEKQQPELCKIYDSILFGTLFFNFRKYGFEEPGDHDEHGLNFEVFQTRTGEYPVKTGPNHVGSVGCVFVPLPRGARKTSEVLAYMDEIRLTRAKCLKKEREEYPRDFPDEQLHTGRGGLTTGDAIFQVKAPGTRCGSSFATQFEFYVVYGDGTGETAFVYRTRDSQTPNRAEERVYVEDTLGGVKTAAIPEFFVRLGENTNTLVREPCYATKKRIEFNARQ